ncbi:MAG: D-alanine--D-alanine ligase [Bacteroidales bacterium]|jgi:D-alanine-D-alanine ligase|nr:D-alanine--D-alanine ligase [Bacteroidales bacterium]
MKLKVAIIFGGKSAEHEISLVSATNIYRSVDRIIYEPLLLGIDKQNRWCYHPRYTDGYVDLAERPYFEDASPVYLRVEDNGAAVVHRQSNQVLETFDVAFPIIHGTFGEDGTLQGFLKSLDIPFTGPDVLASAVAMDKDVTKRLLRDAQIPVADFFTLFKHHPSAHSYEEITRRLGLPVFVKPANSGSSVGVSKAVDKRSFEQAVADAFRFDNKILVEEAIIGKEVECAVLGNEQPKLSVVGEIVPTKDFYSYDAKYLSVDGAKLKIPADIAPDLADAIRQTAAKAYRAISCEGMARVDFLLRNDGSFVLNEINTLPGFTAISMYPKLWEHAGILYKDLITELIQLAVARRIRDAKLFRGNEQYA